MGELLNDTLIYFQILFISKITSSFFFFREIVTVDEVPVDMRSQTEEKRQELIEHLSNVDDTLGEIFLGMLHL